jgi:hypothetical protein
MLQKHRNASYENTINDFKMEIFYQMCASIIAMFKCTACLHTPPHPTPPNSQCSRQHDFDEGKTFYHETCHKRCEIIPVSYLRLNPLNAKLNPICYLLALLGAHHFLHVSRERVSDLQQMWFMSSP